MPTSSKDRYGPIVAMVASARDPMNKYAVRYKDGNYSCNCPGYRFRRECRHIRFCRDRRITDSCEEPEFIQPIEERYADQIVRLFAANSPGRRDANASRTTIANIIRKAIEESGGNSIQNAPSKPGGALPTARRRIQVFTLDD